MKFWLNRDSESDNIVVVTTGAIVIGSCDSEFYDSVESRLREKEQPSVVLGKGNYTAIQFSIIQNIVSRNTDIDVDINYKEGKDIESKTAGFENDAAKDEFIKVLTIVLPETFEKTEYQQSLLAATVSPLLVFVFGVFASYLYFDKWRWVAIIVGGLWMACSLWYLIYRFRSPPYIIRWSIKGRYVRKTWHLIKTGFSFAFAILVVTVFSFTLPNAYGPESLYLQMQENELTADQVEKYISRGGDINYQDQEGQTPLMLAAQWGESEVVKALIEQGADLSLRDNYEQTAVYHSMFSGDVEIPLAILDASPAGEDKTSLLQHAIYNESPVEVLAKLEMLGANLHWTDDEGNNLLAIALYDAENIDLLKYLISKGVSTQFKIDGFLPAKYSRESLGREDVAVLFEN